MPRTMRDPLSLLLAALILPPAVALGLNLGAAERATVEVSTGLREGRLLPCPEDADCVSSEQGTAQALPVAGDPERAFDDLLHFLREARGARVLERGDGYARLLFVTPFLKLADELELRLDEEGRAIHLRAFARMDARWIDGAAPLAASVRAAWGRADAGGD